MSEGIVIAAAFCGLAAILYKPCKKFFKNWLGKYSNDINDKISSLSNLNENTKHLITQYVEKNAQVEKAIKKMIDDAVKTSEDLRKNAISDLNKVLDEKLSYANYRFSRDVFLAMQEIRKTSMLSAVEAFKKYIKNDLVEKELSAEYLEDLKKKMH